MHRLLWECCLRQSEVAEIARKDKSGPLYFELSAMLMAYFTYEAYLNFLGERVAPEAWKDERTYFTEVLHFFRPTLVQGNYREYFVEIEFSWL